MNVDLKGTLQSENLLLDTEEPLVPTAESHFIETPLSFDVEHETAMKWFAVTTNDLKLTRVAIAPSACCGNLCDGNLSTPGKERTCLCLEKSGLGSNALRARVSWQEAGGQRTSKQVIEMQSVRALAIFATEPQKIESNSAVYNAFNFKASVNAKITEYNEAPGFRLLGWYKPSKNEGDMCTEAHSIHVVQLKVNGNETDVRKYAAHVALNADGNVQQERPQEGSTVPAVSQPNPRQGSAVPSGTRGALDF